MRHLTNALIGAALFLGGILMYSVGGAASLAVVAGFVLSMIGLGFLVYVFIRNNQFIEWILRKVKTKMEKLDAPDKQS